MCLMETMQSKRQKLSEISENNWYLEILAFFFGGGGWQSTENDVYIYLLLVGMTFEWPSECDLELDQTMRLTCP